MRETTAEGRTATETRTLAVQRDDDSPVPAIAFDLATPRAGQSFAAAGGDAVAGRRRRAARRSVHRRPDREDLYVGVGP